MNADDWGRLNGKVAVVTGGSRGIGLACAAELRAGGAQVAISGRDAATLEAARATLDGDVLLLPGDVADPATARRAVEAVLARFGRLDILVNNAGGPPQDSLLVDLPLDVFDAALGLNLRAPLVWTAEAWRQWMKDHGGVVLNIASTAGLSIPPRMGAYAVAKAGLIHMTKVLAAELGPKVRVNALAPGLVRTDATSSVFQAAEAPIAAGLPMERLGEPSDIAPAVRFLVSDLAPWMTGETVAIEGGALIARGKGAAMRPAS